MEWEMMNDDINDWKIEYGVVVVVEKESNVIKRSVRVCVLYTHIGIVNEMNIHQLLWVRKEWMKEGGWKEWIKCSKILKEMPHSWCYFLVVAFLRTCSCMPQWLCDTRLHYYTTIHYWVIKKIKSENGNHTVKRTTTTVAVAAVARAIVRRAYIYIGMTK